MPGTLFARWRTGGAVLLPRANCLSAAVWGELLRYRPPRVFQPCFGKFFFGFVADPSGSAVGARLNHGHAITCAAVDLTSTPARWRHSGVKNRQMTLFLALLNEHEPTVDGGHRRRCIVDLLTVEADPALIDRAPGIAL